MSSSHDRSRRRDSPPHSSRRDDRRGSPRPSRSSPPRTERDLPVQFGRVPDDSSKDDDANVIQRMKHGPAASPLCSLYKCIDGSYRLRVWTRNYKEVRGICTGLVVAFDKHWNLIMTDVAEVYLKPRKGKTPYIDESTGDSLLELPAKVPKKKKDASSKETEAKASTVAEPDKVAEGDPSTAEKKKKRRKKKKTSPTSHQREMKQCFIRGDNVVMIAVVDAKSDED